MEPELSFKHLINSNQLSHEDIYLLTHNALKLKEEKHPTTLFSSPKILATLFFEPSTRTRFSFEAAMIKLGGQYINLEQGSSSSLSKGERLEDMGKIISAYADIIVMRHPQKGSVQTFATYADVPVINGGDGPNEHPTQSLTDLMTIYEEKKKLNELHIGFSGDLRFGRTTNSLIKILSTYTNNHFSFVTLPEFQISDTLRIFLKDKKQSFSEHTQLKHIIKDLDILYVTRTQTERLPKHPLHELPPITLDVLKTSNKNLTLLHPLPRITELDTKVDTHPSAKYFEQAKNGLYMRMALIKHLIQ